MNKIKKIIILGVTLLFTSSIFSTNSNNFFNHVDLFFNSCEDYCEGYADGAEAYSGQEWTFLKWKTVKLDCMENSQYCKL